MEFKEPWERLLAQIADEPDAMRRVELLAQLARMLHSMTALIHDVLREQRKGADDVDSTHVRLN